MRMKSNLKKVLSVVLAASVVATTSALAGLAANGTDTTDETVSAVSLLPVYDQVTPVVNGQEGNLTITVDGNGKINTAATAWSWPSAQIVYDPPLEINIVENPILKYVIGGDGAEADFVITYSGKKRGKQDLWILRFPWL